MKTPKPINIPPVTKKLAYLCGVLAGDGYIGIRPNKNEYVVNCGGNPKDEVEFYNHHLAPLLQELKLNQCYLEERRKIKRMVSTFTQKI